MPNTDKAGQPGLEAVPAAHDYPIPVGSDYSTLEVAQYGGAAPAYAPTTPLKDAQHTYAAHEYSPSGFDGAIKGDGYAERGSGGTVTGAGAGAGGASFLIRFRWWLAGAGAALLVIALGVGLGVGLSKGSGDSGSGSGSGSGDASGSSGGDGTGTGSKAVSVCSGSMCPQAIGAAAISSGLYVYGRGNDNAIWFRKGNGTAWTGSWTSTGGSFQSQPNAMPWMRDGDTDDISVYAVGQSGAHVLVWSLSTQQWTGLGDTSVPAVPATCGTDIDRSDAWIVDKSTSNIAHKWTYDATNMGPSLTGWDTAIPAQLAGSAPSVVCRNISQSYNDVVVYDLNSAAVAHVYWNRTADDWSKNWVSQGGSFKGNPTLVESDGDLVHFFGVGKDAKAYHFDWYYKTRSYSALDALGSQKLESDVAALATTVDGATRIHVAAVGTDDTLKHAVWQDDQLILDWEDLGIFANSAPSMFWADKNQTSIGVAVIGHRNALNYTSYTVSSTSSWKDLTWQGASGNLSTSYLTM